MRILVSGASGLIGGALAAALRSEGHEIIPLVRTRAKTGVLWNPDAGEFDREAAQGADAVVHLAGENIASGRWSEDRKRAIRESRRRGTALLAEGVAGLERRPAVLIAASATGFYGNRGEEVLDEAAAPGEGFLAEVCREWEGATRPAAEAGIRVAHLRFGVVLDRNGGALAKMLPIFRLGLGGRVGSGVQWMSWITLPDAVGAIQHVLAGDADGAFNVVAPSPVRNEEFTKALGAAIGRPTWIPVPAAALHLVFGEMAEETLLASVRAVPARLLETGFRFSSPTIEEGLRTSLA